MQPDGQYGDMHFFTSFFMFLSSIYYTRFGIPGHSFKRLICIGVRNTQGLTSRVAEARLVSGHVRIYAAITVIGGNGCGAFWSDRHQLYHGMVIGAGALAGRLCVEAVYSRSMEKARAFAERYGAKKAFDTLGDLYSDKDVDAIYIASPNCCHYEQAMGALTHGKHVLVEKPAAPSEAEFVSMLQAAKANGVLLLEAMRPAFSPGIAMVKRYINDIAPVR